MNLDAFLSPRMISILILSIPVLIAVVGYLVIKAIYQPRNMKEWNKYFSNPDSREHMKERKKRLDAIMNRRPATVVPGIPSNRRDFALEPLIRQRKFKEAKAHIMEQMRRYQQSPDGGGKLEAYIQYLELIEGTG